MSEVVEGGRSGGRNPGGKGGFQWVSRIPHGTVAATTISTAMYSTFNWHPDKLH